MPNFDQLIEPVPQQKPKTLDDIVEPIPQHTQPQQPQKKAKTFDDLIEPVPDGVKATMSTPDYLEARKDKHGAIGSFFSGGRQGFAEYASSINKLIGDKQGQEYWERDKAEQQVKTQDHKIAALGGEMILDPVNFVPGGVLSKASKLGKVAKVAGSMGAGAAIGAGTEAFKNYGDTTKTNNQKLEEIGISAGVMGVLNGVIAGLTKGKVTNALGGFDDLVDKEAHNITSKTDPYNMNDIQLKAIDEVIANPSKHNVSTEDVIKLQKIKDSVDNPIKKNDPMDAVRAENPILQHPRADEAIELARDRYAKQTYNDRVGGSSSIWMDENYQYHRAGNKGDKNPHQGFSLTKADVAKIDKGEITPEITAKLEDDVARLDADPTWRDNRSTPDNLEIQKQAKELHLEHKATQEGKPDGMSLEEWSKKPDDMTSSDWVEAQTMFANGGGNAFGGAMGGGTLGGADAAYEDIVEGKDLTMEDYLMRIGAGAAIGAGIGHKFGGSSANGVGANMANKERKNIYKVASGDKPSTVIKKYDSSSIDEMIEFHSGDVGYGSKHIATRHMQDGSTGKVSVDELTAIGNIIKNGDVVVKDSGKRVYTLFKDGQRFRAVTGENKNGETVISFYSNRTPSGSHNAHQQPEVHEGIISFKPKTDFKSWYKQSLSGGADDGVRLGAFAGKSPQSIKTMAEKETRKAGIGNDSLTYNYTNSSNDIISQNPKMRKAFLRIPDIKDNATAKNMYDTTKAYLGRVVGDETVQDWSDARATIRNMFRDSLGGEYHKAREMVTAKLGGHSVHMERLQKTLGELSEKDRTDLHGYMTGEGTELSPEIEPLARMLKDDIQGLGKELVDGKVLSQEAYDEWAGFYMHRSYEKHLLKDVKALMGKGFTIDEIHARGKIETISKEEADNLTNNLWTDTPDNPFNKPLKDGGIRLIDKKDGTFEVRRDWTKQERESMGEVRDGAVTIVDTLMRMKRMVDNANFLKDVEGMDAVVLKDFREEAYDLMGNKIEGKATLNQEELKAMGFVEVSNNPKFGALAGKAIRKDVYDDIVAMQDELFNTFHGADGAMGRIWKSYLSIWKKSKTVWNAPSHVNNFMSNLFLMHLAGMSGKDVTLAVAKAGKMMYKEKHYEELLAKQMKGQASVSEIAELAEVGKELKYLIEAKETGLLGRSQLNDIMGGQQGAIRKRGLLSKMDKFAQDAYHNGDVINRIAMYTHLRDKLGKSPDEARKAVLSLMPDYSKPMPKGYRILRDTGISPFISWTYYTMPAVIKQMKTKTGAKQMAKVVGLVSAMEYILTEGEVKPWDNLPFVEGNKPNSFTGRRFAVGKNGSKIETVKMDRWIPYLELQDPMNFVMGQLGGPTVKAFTNLGTAMSKGGMVDTYSGRGVTSQNKPLGDRIYDNSKYLIQNYVPLPAQAYSSYDFIESISRSKKKRRKNSVIDPRTTNQSILKLLGLNTMTFDKDNLKRERKKK